MGFKQHQSVGPYAEMPVAKKGYLRMIQKDPAETIIDNDKIIPVAMVFIKVNFHKNLF